MAKVELRRARLFMVKMDDDTDLSRADLRTVEFNPLAAETQNELRKGIDQAVADQKVHGQVLDSLSAVLGRQSQNPRWTPRLLPKYKRREVMERNKWPSDDSARALTDGEGLVSPDDDTTYGKALADDLVPFACEMHDAGVSTRIAQRLGRLGDDAFAAFARQLTAGCPGLIDKLGTEERQRVMDAAAKR